MESSTYKWHLKLLNCVNAPKEDYTERRSRNKLHVISTVKNEAVENAINMTKSYH